LCRLVPLKVVGLEMMYRSATEFSHVFCKQKTKLMRRNITYSLAQK